MKFDCEIEDSSFKLSILFIIIFLSFICIVSYNQRQIFINSHKENLKILAQDKANQINTFLESQNDKLLIIASMPEFINAALHPNDKVVLEIAKNKIDQLKSNIPGIGILTNKGIIIVSENNPAGADYSALPQFPAGDNFGATFTRYYDKTRNKNYYALGGPIYDPILKNKVIGVITFDVEVDKLGSLIKDTPETNNEVYFTDTDGMILSSSKDYVSSVNIKPRQQILNGAVKECMEDLKKYNTGNLVAEHAEGVLEYVNYKQVNVFGTHAYTPNIKGCIIAEESADEILKFSVVDAFGKLFNPFLY